MSELSQQEQQTFEQDADEKWYLNYPVETVGSDAMANLLRHTKTTPVVGGHPYTFRVETTTKKGARDFIQSMRVALSRLRGKAINQRITIPPFTIQQVSCDEIVINQKPSNLIFYLITLERRADPRNSDTSIPMALLDFLFDPNDNTKENITIRNMLAQLKSQRFVEIDVANWDQMCAAMWCVTQNYAVHKHFNSLDNFHVIAMY